MTRVARFKELDQALGHVPYYKYVTTRPERGPYWLCLWQMNAPVYCTTVKEMVDFIESRPGSNVTYVRQT